MGMETAKQKKQRLIRLVHVAKTQLMMNDSDYRKLLANISLGKTSSTLLSIDELELVIRALKARGFQVTSKHQLKMGVPDLVVHSGSMEREAQIKKIRALWLELHQLGVVKDPSELSLAKFVKKMTGVDCHVWLNLEKASNVIEHLKKWRVRVLEKREREMKNG